MSEGSDVSNVKDMPSSAVASIGREYIAVRFRSQACRSDVRAGEGLGGSC